MEHWNKDNISIKIKKEYNQLENTKKSISELYKFYVESMQNTTHTLRQTIWISLIEEYFEKEPRTFINKYKDSKLNFKNIIKKENEFRNEKSKIPKYETYKEHFIQGINNIFEVLFGANVSIHIFAGKDKNKEIIDYEIDEADGLFLACLMTTYHTNDAQNFICGNYDAVSEVFFNLILPGAESLVKSNRVPGMTIEKLKERFDIKFKLQKRRVKTKLNDVMKEFNMIVSIIDESINQMTEDKIYERCDQCIEILTIQQQQLFEFRTLLNKDNPITKDDINKIIELHKVQTKQNLNDNCDGEKAKKDLLPLLDLPV